MKTDEKQKAIILRNKGVSMGDIAEKLGVAKSSVSYWVRDIPLTKSQKTKLNRNGHSIVAIEKRRISRILHTNKKRDEIKKNAGEEVPLLMRDPLWCVGTALYWGEGGKTQQTARVSNSDPRVIKIMMRFFEQYSGIPKEKYKAHIHTFSHKNVKEAMRYWVKVSGIPEIQFYRTYVKQSSASKKKRNTLPYGTLQIYLHDSDFFTRLMGWIDRLKELGENE